jgi:hypothetical protein
MNTRSAIDTAILDINARAHEGEPRVTLADGTTIRDVYAQFRDGLGDIVRNRDELRDVIHAAGLRYEDCSRLSVSLAWAQLQSDESHWHVDTLT